MSQHHHQPPEDQGHDHPRQREDGHGCGCQGGGRCADCPCRRRGEPQATLDTPGNT